MKLDYKSKKWDKLLNEINKSQKFFNNHFTGEFCYYNINNEYSNFISSKSKDYIWFYNYLSHEFDRAADICAILNKPYKEMLKNIYFSVRAFVIFYNLLLQNNFYNDSCNNTYFLEDLNKIDLILLKAISINRIADFKEVFPENIVVNLYNKHLDKAKRIIERINTPTDKECENEIYFTSNAFLKELYLALIECNERKFIDLLAQRIKKYRKNPVDYATIIDYPSIALIKIAKIYGIHSDCSIIEIPSVFYDKLDYDFLDIKIPIPDVLDRILSQGYLSDGFTYELR